MQLLPELAKKIIEEVQMLLNEDVIVLDERSIIIASTDPNRIGNFHEGAKLVLQTKQKLYITPEMANRMKGVKTGINLPILFNTHVIGVIGITGTPQKVEPYAEILRRMTELIIREFYHLEQKEWETRGFEAFFYEWVTIKEIDEEFMQRGEILGIPMETSYICALFQLEISSTPQKTQEAQIAMMDWFINYFSRAPEDFFIRWGHGTFLLLKNLENKGSWSLFCSELKKWHSYFSRENDWYLSIGVGKTSEPIFIQKSYEEAKTSLNVAKKTNSIIFYDQLLLDIVLEEISDRTRTEFLQRVILRLEKDIELIQTLHNYIDCNQSIKQTADRMHVHTNTLHYRLRQIKEITGIDPKSTKGIAMFYVALALMK